MLAIHIQAQPFDIPNTPIDLLDAHEHGPLLRGTYLQDGGGRILRDVISCNCLTGEVQLWHPDHFSVSIKKSAPIRLFTRLGGIELATWLQLAVWAASRRQAAAASARHDAAFRRIRANLLDLQVAAASASFDLDIFRLGATNAGWIALHPEP